MLWGWWAFAVAHASTATGLVNFSRGGFQEARGGSIGEHFYIEGLLEELDYPREWYASDTELFYMPGLDERDLQAQTITAPVLETVVRVKGTMALPVRHLRFEGIEISHSKTTYMEPYEVPSGER